MFCSYSWLQKQLFRFFKDVALSSWSLKIFLVFDAAYDVLSFPLATSRVSHKKYKKHRTITCSKPFTDQIPQRGILKNIGDWFYVRNIVILWSLGYAYKKYSVIKIPQDTNFMITSYV